MKPNENSNKVQKINSSKGQSFVLKMGVISDNSNLKDQYLNLVSKQIIFKKKQCIILILTDLNKKKAIHTLKDKYK